MPDAAPEVGAGAVHLVDEADPRHVVAVGLPPDRLRLRLDAGDAVEDDDRAVEDAEAPLDLDREVHVPGRVDEVDAMVAPEAGRRRRGDRDPPLLLLGHPVHRRGALVDLAHLVDLARVEEDPLGDGGLAGVDVGDDADVAGAGERVESGHSGSPVLPLVVAEGLVRLGHLVGVLAALDRRARPFAASTSSAASFSAHALAVRACARPGRASASPATGGGRRGSRPAPGTWRRRPGEA